LSQNAGRHTSNLGATTAIAAPAMTSWLYCPVKPRWSMYLYTGATMRGSMQETSIAS